MNYFKKIFVIVAVAFIGLSISSSVFADGCTPKLQITYPDGEKGCLSDLPISKDISKQWGRSIKSLAEYAPYYVLIAGDVCKSTEIFIGPNGFASSAVDTPARARYATKNCPSGCNCAIVVNDGKVLLNKNLALALGSAKLEEPAIAQVNAMPSNPVAVENKVANSKDTGTKLVEAPTDKSKQSDPSIALQQDRQKPTKEVSPKPIEVAIDTPKQNDQLLAVQQERQKDRELLLQLSAELARLRSENAAVKEDQKLLSQSIASAANANSQPQSPQIFVNRKALVIGNDSYKFVSKLANAREDAKAMAEGLSGVGYQVTVKYDLTERELKSTLRNFKDQVEAGDEVAIFYAGHGVQLANSNFLLPVDVAGEGEDQIRDEAISLQRILDDMSSRKAKFTLAMIDACRDNPFKGHGRSIGGLSRGLAPTTAATGQMVIFSAGSGQQALDKLGPSDKDKNGVFTRVFVKEMKKPGVSIDKVVRNVRVEVVNLAKSAGHEQVPAIYDQVVGEFYFKK